MSTDFCNCNSGCSDGSCRIGAKGGGCGCSANCNCGCKQGKPCTCNAQHSAAAQSQRSNQITPAQQQWQDTQKIGCGCKKK